MSNVSIENELNKINDNLVDNNINNIDSTFSDNVESIDDFDNNVSPSLSETEISSNLENDMVPEEECTSLVVVKDNKLFVAQKMFKKSIKISIKSFLISLSLGFLNLFI